MYANSFTEMHEFLRLPVLYAHFEEHKQLVNDLTLWEFLTLHYQSDGANHDPEDSRLPFKDPRHSFTVPAVALPFQRITLADFVSPFVVIHYSTYSEAFVSSPLKDIFQPPRA